MAFAACVNWASEWPAIRTMISGPARGARYDSGVMTAPKRLIETAFPLEQVSLDSVHEKNVRHGQPVGPGAGRPPRPARARRGRASDKADDGNDAPGGADAAGRGGTVRLKPWNRRRAKTLGADAPDGRPAPLVDQAHRLMQLWRDGDESKVNDYLDARGLTRHALFSRLLQAVIELAPAGSEERTVLESLSNHVAARGGVTAARQPRML